MGNCNGNCAACGGCGKELELTAGEVEFLELLGQIPFLPVGRRIDDPAPIYPGGENPEQMSLMLQCLEKKGLISLDYDQPLKGCKLESYAACPLRGSIALTARGQQVLELIDYQGIHP